MFIHVPINFQQWSLPLETILSTFWSSNWAGWVTNVYRAAWHCWTSAPTEGGERRGSGLDILYDIICTHTYCGIIIHIFAIYIVDFCYICLNTQKNTHECFESRCYPRKSSRPAAMLWAGDAAINPVPNLWSPCSPATKLSHPPAVVWKRPSVAPTDHPSWTPILRNENKHNFFGRHS